MGFDIKTDNSYYTLGLKLNFDCVWLKAIQKMIGLMPAKL